MADQKRHNKQLDVEEALNQSEAFITKHKKAVIGGAAAVIIIIGSIFAYTHLYAAPREKRAEAAIFKGQEYFEQGAFDQALNGDSIGYAGFLKIADEYGGTKTGNLANAYIGICQKKLGNIEAAAKSLEKFDGDDLMVSPAILAAAGNCYAELGNNGKAVSLLLKAADKADNNLLSPLFLLQAGELLVKEGKYDAAVEAYTKIKDDYAQSFQAMEIDKYIEQAKLQKK
jgi:tetratricopeptide (TPR) repeat protein